MEYNCKVVFTTRCIYEDYASITLKEISSMEALMSLAGNLYDKAKKDPDTTRQIIEAVHCHTFIVTLAFKLLQTGSLRPKKLLKKLKAENAAMDAEDEICMKKDGHQKTTTYYRHLRLLFTIYKLSDKEQDVMRCLSLLPSYGVSEQTFAEWMQLKNCNTINKLISKGLIEVQYGRQISLHPMIQEITIVDTQPSVQACKKLLQGQKLILNNYADIPEYNSLFETIENSTRLLTKDDDKYYLQFLINVFPYMQNYNYESGMTTVISELTCLFNKTPSIFSIDEQALFWDCQASFEADIKHKTETAIDFEERAIRLLENEPKKYVLQIINFENNIITYYRSNNDKASALLHFNRIFQLRQDYNPSNIDVDYVTQTINYASLLYDMSTHDKSNAYSGIEKLKQLEASILRQSRSDIVYTTIFANIYETIGYGYAVLKEYDSAIEYFKRVLNIYFQISQANPEAYGNVIQKYYDLVALLPEKNQQYLELPH